MARAGNNNYKGQVRVEQSDEDPSVPPVPVFVDTTNSGAFQSITRVETGEYDVAMNDSFLLTIRDVIQPQIEGATVGAATINVQTQGVLKVRTFLVGGDPADLPFSLRIVETFRG